MRRIGGIAVLLVSLAACGAGTTTTTMAIQMPTISVGDAECTRLTTEMVEAFDAVLDRLDVDPTLLPNDIPETEQALGQSFALGAACIADTGLAFSAILEFLDDQSRIRPTATGDVIAEMIGGLCQVDTGGLFEWTERAAAICAG